MKSFVQFEKELAAEFRDKLTKTETTIEVSDLFSQTAQKLLSKILPDYSPKAGFQIKFDSTKPPYYIIPEEMKKDERIKELIEDSDFPAILERFATSCYNRKAHLDEVEKTKTSRRPPGTPNL